MGSLFSPRIVDKNWRSSSDVEKRIVDELRTSDSFVCIDDFKALTRILENGVGMANGITFCSHPTLAFRCGRIDKLSIRGDDSLFEDSELSGQIRKLDALQCLELLNFTFRSLPSDWSNMKSLKHLYLQMLNVDDLDLVVFSTIASLEELIIKDEDWFDWLRVKNLKTLSKLKSLKNLELFGCEFEGEVIGNLPSLQYLKMWGCMSIDSICNLPSLQHLELRDCASIDSICNLPSLQHLELDDCASIDSICNLPSLQNLKVDGCILESIHNLPSLQELWLTELEPWRSNGCPLIKCDISSCSQTLKSITIQDESEVQLTSIICPNVTHFKMLLSPDMTENESLLLQHIKWATMYLPSLESFQVDTSFWSREKQNGLLKALSSSRFNKLRNIDIGYISQGDVASFFFTCLKCFPYLEHFSLRKFDSRSMDEIENGLRNNEEYARLAWKSNIKSFRLFSGSYNNNNSNNDDDDYDYDFDYIIRAFPSLQKLRRNDRRLPLHDQNCDIFCLNQAGRAFVEGQKGVAPRTLSKAIWPALLAKTGSRTYCCTNKIEQANVDEKEKHQKTIQYSGVFYLLRNGPVILKYLQEGNRDGSSRRKSTCTVQLSSSKRPKLSGT